MLSLLALGGFLLKKFHIDKIKLKDTKMQRKLYMFWTGNNQPSNARIRAVNATMQSCNVEFILKVGDSVHELELPEYPFHEAYNYLSLTHKADYLRCYVMHHYGGGYADIKIWDFDWNPYFDALENSDRWAIGHRELSPDGVAIVPNDPLATVIKASYENLIGNCGYIFKPNTPFTTEWKKQLHLKLDSKLEELRSNPSRHPQDVINARFMDGTISRYPLRWAEILGEIFHKLCYQNQDKLIPDLPRYTYVKNYR